MMRTLNGTLLRTVIVAALGGSLLGFDTAVIAGATQSLVRVFALTPAQLGVTVSAALWGTIVGAMAAGGLGRKYGGRTSLVILGACYLVSALGCALANSWEVLLICRVIGGLGMGGSSVIAPVYIAEIAPASWRGRLVGAFQINIIVGILLAYLSNYIIGLASFGDGEWRWQLGVAAAPAALFLLMLIGIAQSPRWLAARGCPSEARETLRKLGSPAPDAELAQIRAALAADAGPQAQRLFQRRYRRPIVLALALAVFNQLIGINAVLYYLNDIFAMAGFDRTSQNAQAVAVGAVMLVATLVALSLIDRFGRRTLLLVGSVGLAVCLAGIAAIFYSKQYQHLLLMLLIGYVGFFAFSQGAVIWVYLSEIFPASVRAQGQSLGSSTHWVMNALVSAAFPVLAAYSQAGPFVFFLVIVVLQFFAVLLFFPETSGVSLEDMQRRMDGNGSGRSSETATPNAAERGRSSALMCVPAALLCGLLLASPDVSGATHAPAPADAAIATASVSQVSAVSPSQSTWQGRGEVGAVSTRGNSSVDSANVRVDVVREAGRWTYVAGLAALRARAAGATSAARYEARMQTNLEFAERRYWFGGMRYAEDRFSGFEYETSVTTGYRRAFVESEKLRLSGQLGVGYRRLGNTLAGELQAGPIAKADVDVERALTVTTRVVNRFTSEAGSDTTLLENRLAVEVRITKALALSLAATLRFNSNPPEHRPALDRLTTINLVYAVGRKGRGIAT